MPKPFTLVAVALALCACESYQLAPPPSAVVNADAGAVVDPQEIIVVANSASAMDALARKAERVGYRIGARETLEGLDLILLSIGLPAGQSGGAAIRELESMEPSVTAGVNHAYTPQGQNAARRYAHGLLSWAGDGCDAEAPIGLIDTALDLDALGAQARRVVTEDVSRQAASEGADHATAIARILLDETLLTDVSLFHADAVALEGELGAAASVDSLMRAINWMAKADVRLVNISLAGPYNKILDRGFQRAASRGMIVVAAAGNVGPSGPPRYPAGFASTIAVTAVDGRARIYKDAVVGDHIDFAAPGVDIYIPTSEGGAYVSGTSMAAPFVALRIAGDPSALSERSIETVRETLAATALDLGDPGPDPIYGRGLIRAPEACRSSE